MNRTFGKRFLSLALSTVMCLGGTTAINALAYNDTADSTSQGTTTQRAILVLTKKIGSAKGHFVLEVTFNYNDGVGLIAGIRKAVCCEKVDGYKVKKITYLTKNNGNSYIFTIHYTDPNGNNGTESATLWAELVSIGD